jgi:hypothetical protein
LKAVAVGCTNDERPLVLLLLLLLFDAVEPLLNPSVRELAAFVLLGKGQRGLTSLVIRFFFLYGMPLVGSVSFFSRTNGMSRYAGICGVLCVTLRACTYCEVLLEKPVSLFCQQVPGVFLNPTVHYRIHKSPAYIHILSLLN